MADSTLIDSLLSNIGRFKNNLRYGIPVPPDATDPTEGPEDSTSNIIDRNSKLTFETIYQNLASYPNEIDISDPTYMTKVFYMEDNKRIDIIIDIREDGKILTTMSGDLGIDNVDSIIKDVRYDDLDIDTTYHTVYVDNNE